MMQYRLFLSVLMGTIIFSGTAFSADKRDVYLAKAPVGCLDKEIAVNKEVSLIDLIKIGICNNPELSADYMSLKASEENLGAAK